MRICRRLLAAREREHVVSLQYGDGIRVLVGL